MKKWIFVLLFILLFSQYSFARNIMSSDSNNAIKKLGRGFANVIVAPIEILQAIKDVHNERGPIEGLTYGTVLGVVNGLDRIAVGISEILTFPSPGPKEDYKPILEDPKFLQPNSIFVNNLDKNKNVM